MKRGAALFPQLDVNGAALRATCAGFRFAPERFAYPVHRSVAPDDVAAFAYAADGGGAPRTLDVSNLLKGTPREDDLLGALGLDDADAAGRWL